MRIVSIREKSPAADLGLRAGDELLAINGHPVSDLIDFLYHASEVDLRLEIGRGKKRFQVEVSCEVPSELGLTFEEMGPRTCGDDCVFCFIDQNPAGVRPSLMVKDEDFRLSFLHGNYVTLDNLSRSDHQRILEQRLSPLYVSVHTTDPDLRTRMLRGRRSAEILDRLDRLIEGGITIHAQIVLVPEWNDREHLRKTVHDLADRHPGIASIAVVPVGLTDHREGLTPLRRPTSEEMREVIEQGEEWRHVFRDRSGTGLLYLADEYFLASGVPLPERAWYDEFPQLENGVGMARYFVDRFRERAQELAAGLERAGMNRDRVLQVAACTGVMGKELFDRYLGDELAAIGGLSFRLVETANTFFGAPVTASGLLSAACLAGALEAERPAEDEIVLLPPNCLNSEGLFLDDVPLEEFAARWPNRVEQGSYDLAGDLLTNAGAARRGGH